VLGGDVGDKQGRTDEEPADVAAGEEVIGGCAFLTGEIQADAKDDQEVDADNPEVEGRQRMVGNRCGWIHD